MSLFGELRSRARSVVGPVLAVTVFTYLSYHAVEGDRGLMAWLKLSQKVDDAQAEYNRISARREELAHRVQRLDPESLDLDLADQQARAVLGYIRPDEVLIELDSEGRIARTPGGLHVPGYVRAARGAGDALPLRISLSR